MKSVFRWYLRWRHGKGFGIHSPFAFDFLRSELRPPRGYAYYKYDRLPHSDTYGDDTLRLLFRILLRLRPGRVCIEGGDLALSDTVLLACPGVRFASATESDMLIVAHDTDPIAADRHAHLLILPPYTRAKMRLWRSRLRSARRGMSFGSRHSRALVFVANPKLPRQDFDIRF